MNELKVCDSKYSNGDRGYRTVFIGPEHGAYAAFHPIPGMGLGYNDQKIIEVQDILRAVADGKPAQPDFSFGDKISVTVAAIERSIAERRWVETSEIHAESP